MSKRSIVHVEIPVANQGAASTFYHDLFGWEMDPRPEVQYTLFSTGSVGGGFPDVSGMYPLGGVVVHISSENLEEDLKRVEAAGGKAVGDIIDMGPNGAMAFFTDPTGNRLALYKAPAGAQPRS